MNIISASEKHLNVLQIKKNTPFLNQVKQTSAALKFLCGFYSLFQTSWWLDITFILCFLTSWTIVVHPFSALFIHLLVFPSSLLVLSMSLTFLVFSSAVLVYVSQFCFFFFYCHSLVALQFIIISPTATLIGSYHNATWQREMRKKNVHTHKHRFHMQLQMFCLGMYINMFCVCGI